MTPPPSDPSLSVPLEKRIRKLLMLNYLGAWILIVLSAGGILLLEQSAHRSQAAAARVINEVRGLGGQAQKVVFQGILYNQAAAVDKDRRLRDSKNSISELRKKWDELKTDPMLASAGTHIESKVNRLAKRVEAVHEMRPGIALSREDYESLYLLQTELSQQLDSVAGAQTAQAAAAARRHVFSWAVVGAIAVLSAAVLLLVCRPLGMRLAKETGKLETELQSLQLRSISGEDKHREKAYFIAHAGQRLRKAVNEIVHHSATLEEQLRQKHHGENADYAAWIRIRGSQILGVINDMLNLAFVESGLIQYLPRAINLTELLQSMTEHLKPLADEKGLVFTLSLPPQPVWVMGDSDQIWRMIEKIYDNAVKYTQHGEVSITVSALPDGRATIAVRDTGIGIPGDLLPHIFDPQPFEEEKETSLEEGLGINLSVARQLAALMGSLISVRSDVDKGTTFLIDMPMCTPDGQLLAK